MLIRTLLITAALIISCIEFQMQGSQPAQTKNAIPEKPTAQPTSPENQYRMPGLYGTFPKATGDFVKKFSTIANDPTLAVSDIEPGSNIMLLHGPSGNGKTEFVRTFASTLKGKVIALKGSTIVGTYQNSGALKIEEIFKQVEHHLDTTQEPILVSIDELEGLNSQRSDQSSNHFDTERAMQTLWQGLSTYERTARVAFIFMANDISKFPKPFLNRIHERFVVEVDYPNEQDRKDLIKKFFILSNISLTDHDELERIEKRALKNIDHKNDEHLHALKAIKNQLVATNDLLKRADKDKESEIVALIENIENANQQLRSAHKTINNQTALSHGIDFYCTCIENRLKTIRASLPFLHFQLNEESLNDIVKNTKYFPIRSLRALAVQMSKIAQPDGTVDFKQRRDLVDTAHMKILLEEKEDREKNNDKRLKVLQLEEAENRKKNYNRDQLAAYFRLVSDLRNAHAPEIPIHIGPHSYHRGSSNTTLNNIVNTYAPGQKISVLDVNKVRTERALNLIKEMEMEDYGHLAKELYLKKMMKEALEKQKTSQKKDSIHKK